MLKVGTPVRMPDGTVGSIVSLDHEKKWAQVALPKDVPHVERFGEGTTKLKATIEIVDVPFEKLEHDFVERHEHTKPNGTKFYTDQHGEVCLNI